MSPSLEQQLEELKQLKAHKGILSGKFKSLTKGTLEHSQQLALMQDISQKISHLEAKIKLTKSQLISETNINSLIDSQLIFPPSCNLVWGKAASITLREFSQVTDWSAFVTNNNASLPSHNPAWIDVIEATFGHSSFILCAHSPSGELLGGIPFTVFSSMLFGKFGVSMPYLNYGGALSQYQDICISLMEALNDVREQLDLKHIEVRSVYGRLARDPSTKKASMLLNLPPNDSELDELLGSKVRAQYKKAEEHSPKTKIGKVNLLNDFYKVFSQNMRDLGTPVYSKQWFKNLLLNPNLDTDIIVIYLNQKPVSCGFLVTHGNLMEIPWASTLKSANKYNTNMWMYRKILSFAIQKGCTIFDFGRSTIDAGTFKFKKQWGAKPVQNYWYTIAAPNTPKPEMNPDNPKLKVFIQLWKRLPLWIANLIGPPIIKHIP